MLRYAIATCLIGITAAVGVATDGAIRVRVTQRYLVARCFNGNAVDPGTRKWDVAPGVVTLAFSMRSDSPAPAVRCPTPAPPRSASKPKRATATKWRYAPTPATFSSRVWRANEWIPVVRDRTTERIVSDAARWSEAGCPER